MKSQAFLPSPFLTPGWQTLPGSGANRLLHPAMISEPGTGNQTWTVSRMLKSKPNATVFRVPKP